MDTKYQKFIQIMSDYCRGYLEDTGGYNYRLGHHLRVADTLYRICISQELPGIQEKIVVIAGLFHDTGRVYLLRAHKNQNLQYNKEELALQEIHEKMSQRVVVDLLSNKLNREEINLVNKVIGNEPFSDNWSLEKKALYDADCLDELGVNNLFRMFTYSVVAKRDIYGTIKYWFEIDRDKKIQKAKTLFTNFARKEAFRRIRLQDNLMRELENSGFKCTF